MKVDVSDTKELIGYLPFFANPVQPGVRDTYSIDNLEEYDEAVGKYFTGNPFDFHKHSFYNLAMFSLVGMAKADVNFFFNAEVDQDKVNILIEKLGKSLTPDINLLHVLFSVANEDVEGISEYFPKLLLSYAHKTPSNMKDYTFQDEAILASMFFSFMVIMGKT